MRTRIRATLAIASLAALAMAVAACGSPSKPTSGANTGLAEIQDGVQGVNPGTGTPVRGGTLNMLGDGDVDWMDYNASYYSIGSCRAVHIGVRNPVCYLRSTVTGTVATKGLWRSW